jgi:hypothetical protein
MDGLGVSKQETHMKLFQRTFWAAAATASVLLAGAATAQAGGVKVGVLKCKVDGGLGLIITSSKNVDCVFKPRHHKWRDHYVGSITKIGADIGFTNGATVIWTVFAPGSVKRGSLAGTYVGASAEATAGVGVGANVLVGGFSRSVNLQPVSLQGQTGLNVAGGIAGLSLRSH